MNQLTWYPGTILPYASLWHTLLRATWLNDLHEGDLAKAARCHTRRRKARPEHLHGAEYRQAIHRALGDSGEAFRFGTFAQWPQCLFPKFVAAGLRWCPACLHGGYHTLFSSLRLVARCPIHGDPLLEVCPDCHQGFKITEKGLCVPSCQTCWCGRVRLLEPTTCRQPSLRREQTQCWNPVAQWLRQVGSVNIGRLPAGDALPDVQLALASWWCRDLGIAYPACFEPNSSFWSNEEEPKRWRRYVAESGNLADPSRTTPGKETDASAEVSVYKSMGLHLRRHGLRRPDNWIVKLITKVDPATFADTMAHSPKARMAFMEMLWARAMNSEAHLRRWPLRRVTEPEFMDPYTIILGNFGHGLQPLARAGGPLPRAAQRWAAFHVVALAANIAWGRATDLTKESISNRWADWSHDPGIFAGRVVWCVRKRGGRFRFAAYVKDACDNEFTANMSNKAQRSEAFRQQERSGHEAIRTLAGARCLIWDVRDGWRTGFAAPADTHEEVKRVRLLHVKPRADFWLYISERRFIARLVNGIIQVSADTAREAIEGLRDALNQYRHMFDADHARFVTTAQERPASLQNYAFALAENIRRVVYGRKDFWSVDPFISPIIRECFWREHHSLEGIGRTNG